MGMNELKTYAIEAYYHSRKPVIGFFAGLTAVWGIFNSLIPTETGWYCLSVLAVIGILYAILKFSILLRQIVNGKMTVPFWGKSRITLVRNDFQNNMDHLLHVLDSQELESFAFVMGIDKTGRLDISSESGVVHSVLQYLNENYKCEDKKPQDYIQKVVNAYLADSSHQDEYGQIAYGKCVEVRLLLTPINNTGNSIGIPCNLVLVANSRKKFPGEEQLKETMLDDDQSNIIVPKVFDYLFDSKKYKGAMMGAMGTNQMGQSYQVVFSQIINQFARILHNDKDNKCVLQNLYISIREVDYRRSTTLSNLVKYVRECTSFYTKQDYSESTI